MSKITVVRTDMELPADLAPARAFLFSAFDGFTKSDKKAWRRFWKKLISLEHGEMATAEMRFPRSSKFHRLHMAMEQSVFDAQERFEQFDQFRNWLKVGAGHVDWFPGPKGGIVPIPKSIAYSALDDVEFHQLHEAMIQFLLTPHAQKALWPHLGEQDRADMMMSVIGEFL